MPNGENEHERLLLSALEALLKDVSNVAYVKDEHLRYIGASRGFCDIFGIRDPDTIAGKTDYDLLPHLLAETAQANDRTVLENARPDAARFDILFVTRTPIIAPDGRVVGLSGIISDIARNPDEVQVTALADVADSGCADVQIPPEGAHVLPIKHPIRMGGTFVARLEADLPIVSASKGFIEMLGPRARSGWIHPEDAAALHRRVKGNDFSMTPFFARLLTADGDEIFARLEFRVSPDGSEFFCAAYNLSDKLAAEESVKKLRITKTIIGRLAMAEFDWVSLIDAQTGVLTVLGRADIPASDIPSEQYDYPGGYERYFRARVIASEADDCVLRMSLDAVKAALEQSDRYELSYSMNEGDEIRRKRWVFSYLDENRNTILHMRSDITDAYMMQFDPVSGLYNRHHFQREARKLLDAHPERRFLFVRFDIDNFRAFNDLYGVTAGNLLIASIRKLIATFHMSLSVCGHIEADHFACVIPEEDYSPMSAVDKIVEWLKSHSPDFDFSPKIGLYAIDDPSLDIVSMSNRALLALNSIKGKYGVHVARYTEAMRERMLVEQSIVNEMCNALNNGEFVPYIQPQYNYLTGAMMGAELLLRWNHPRKGLLVPKDFMPIFERNGFITQIDRHVWASACRFLRHWLDMGLSVVPLSVNVSRADINDPQLCETLCRLIDQHGLDAKLIRLEITETAYMNNPERLIETVKKLRSMGFFVEMDDFGSGYSSLNMLRDVEVDVLKLDMSFLRNLETASRGDSILRSVIRMARLLNIPVIAEGVETVEQAAYLSHVGCRLMQGFFFARPMTAARFEALLSNVNSVDKS